MRRTLRYLTCGAAALLLGGCWWPMPGNTPGRQSHNPAEQQLTTATVQDLHPLWTAETTAGPTGDPVTSAAGVHVNDYTAAYAFATATGDELWAYPSSVAAEQPYVSGDEVWLSAHSSGTGLLLVVDAASGAPLRTEGSQVVTAMSEDHVVTAT